MNDIREKSKGSDLQAVVLATTQSTSLHDTIQVDREKHRGSHRIGIASDLYQSWLATLQSVIRRSSHERVDQKQRIANAAIDLRLWGGFIKMNVLEPALETCTDLWHDVLDLLCCISTSIINVSQNCHMKGQELSQITTFVKEASMLIEGDSVTDNVCRDDSGFEHAAMDESLDEITWCIELLQELTPTLQQIPSVVGLSRTSPSFYPSIEDSKTETMRTSAIRNKDIDRHDLFACPFAKADPICFGPGNLVEFLYRGCSIAYLTDVARVKQHLYRVQSVPQYCCQRCFESFNSVAKLAEHEKSAQKCTARECPFPEKIDLPIIQELKENYPRYSPIEAWYNIYAILFPRLPAPDSPYAAFAMTSMISEESTPFAHNELSSRNQAASFDMTPDSSAFSPSTITLTPMSNTSFEPYSTAHAASYNPLPPLPERHLNSVDTAAESSFPGGTLVELSESGNAAKEAMNKKRSVKPISSSMGSKFNKKRSLLIVHNLMRRTLRRNSTDFQQPLGTDFEQVLGIDLELAGEQLEREHSLGRRAVQ